MRLTTADVHGAYTPEFQPVDNPTAGALRMRDKRENDRRARIPGMIAAEPQLLTWTRRLVEAFALRGLTLPPTTPQAKAIGLLLAGDATGVLSPAAIAAMPAVPPNVKVATLVGAILGAIRDAKLTAGRARLATMRKRVHNTPVLHNPVMAEPKGDENEPSIRGPAGAGPGGSPIPRTAADFFNPSTWARGWYHPTTGERVTEGPVAHHRALLRDVRGRPRRKVP